MLTKFTLYHVSSVESIMIIALKNALSNNEALQRTQIKYRWFLFFEKEFFVCIFIYHFEIFIIKGRIHSKQVTLALDFKMKTMC